MVDCEKGVWHDHEHTRESVDDGGLISYGVNLAAIYRRAASFIDFLLRADEVIE